MTRWGWMVGGGLEWAFAQNWSVKGEFDYLDFGRQRTTFTGLPVLGHNFDYDIRQQISLIKFRINYKFGYGGPIMTRY